MRRGSSGEGTRRRSPIRLARFETIAPGCDPMSRVGRNEPCPCGSGKKFKHCHIDAQDNVVQLPGSWREYPEESVVGPLRASPRFLAFMEKERAALGPIHWVVDPTLEVGIHARSSRIQAPRGDLRSAQRVIRLRRIPPRQEDEFDVVHELAHFVLDAQQFPMVGSSSQHESTASAINGFLHDPLVHRYLRSYGYGDGLTQEHAEEISESMAQLRDATPPTHAVDRAKWAVNYAGKVLDHVEAFGSRDGDEFAQWFATRFPELAREGETVYALIEEFGFDTPDKMREIMRRVVREFHLDAYVVVQG